MCLSCFSQCYDCCIYLRSLCVHLWSLYACAVIVYTCNHCTPAYSLYTCCHLCTSYFIAYICDHCILVVICLHPWSLVYMCSLLCTSVATVGLRSLSMSMVTVDIHGLCNGQFWSLCASVFCSVGMSYSSVQFMSVFTIT